MINKISALVETVKLRRGRRRLIVSDTCPRGAFRLTLTSHVYSDSRPPSENAISDYLHHPSAKSQSCHVCCNLSEAVTPQAWREEERNLSHDLHATVANMTKRFIPITNSRLVFCHRCSRFQRCCKGLGWLLFVECFSLSVSFAKFLIREKAPGHLTTATHCKSIVTWTSKRQTANLLLF